MKKINQWLAENITSAVGTMWAAYLFAALALVSLPAIIDQTGWFGHPFPHWLLNAGLIALVAWVAQTFLQLVLLPVIIVGQNLQATRHDVLVTGQKEIAATHATLSASHRETQREVAALRTVMQELLKAKNAPAPETPTKKAPAKRAASPTKE